MNFGDIIVTFVGMEKKGIATVVKHTGSHYLLSELPKWDLFPAVMRGKIRLNSSTSTNPVAVGDKVEYTIDTDVEGETATIDKILPRSNYIIRRSTNLSRESHVIAANLDKVFLVISMILPETKQEFVDRFLVTCEAYKIKVVIVINKIDLLKGKAGREYLDYFKSIYKPADYKFIEVSATTGEGIDELKKECSMGVNLFSGVSGVGKSSIIKALDPSLNPKTGDISSAHHQGKHTTTFYEMYHLTDGGFIIDTPGIRGFGIVDIEHDELSTYFPEMLKVMDNCRFMPCTHTHEPGCAVKEALEQGLISEERYNSYLGMLEDEKKYR